MVLTLQETMRDLACFSREREKKRKSDFNRETRVFRVYLRPRAKSRLA